METTKVVGFSFQGRPLITKPPPLNRDYNGDPNIKALKRKGFTNQGSTLPSKSVHATLKPQTPNEKDRRPRLGAVGLGFGVSGLGETEPLGIGLGND